MQAKNMSPARKFLYGIMILFGLLLLIPFDTGSTNQVNAQESIQDEITINFFELEIDEDLKYAIVEFINVNKDQLQTNYRDFAISVDYMDDAGILHFGFLPTIVIESNWDFSIADTDFIRLIASYDEGANWLIEFEPSVDIADINALSTNFSFPWTNGQTYAKTGGFHSATSGYYSLDFAPRNGASLDTLAIETGTLRYWCYTSLDPYQAAVRVEHANSITSGYLHLSKGSIPTGKINQTISKGTPIGRLYEGSDKSHNNCPNLANKKYDTHCGCGTGTHLHFEANSLITIQGVGLSTISSAENGTQYTSNNASDNPCAITSVPSGYNHCADEGGTCNFSGTANVIYGANSCYTAARSFSNGIACNNDVFGDPISGVQKKCYTNGSTTPPPTGNWNAKYFSGADHWWDNNNYNNKMCEQNFSGTSLDRNYGSGSPCGNSTTDNWVAEYTTTINFPTGSYVFYAQNDDGLKIWVNGSNIMERGGSSGYYPRCPALNLSGNVPIKAILREEGGDARVKIAWSTDTSVCIPPGSFNKSSPSSGSTGVSTSPTLSWGSSSNATSYHYCIDTSNNNNCDTGWQSNGTSTSKVLSGLNAGTTYYWQARANNEGGEVFANGGTWWSFTVTAPQSAPTLNSPANNTTINRTDAVALSWNTASGATQYYAEFWGGPNININSGWTANTSWALGSQWGGTYQWRVKARNSSGQESGWSETRTLNIRPGTPTNLSGTALSSDQIKLTWSASSDAPGNIDGYRIYRNGSAVATVTGSTTTYQNNGLTCNTDYSFYVKAYKGSIESNASNTVAVKTQACPPAVRVVAVDTRDGNWGVKTFFTPGNPIQWTIHVENTTNSDIQVVIGYIVKNPSNTVIHNSTHTVTTSPGTWMWGLPSTVDLPGGDYTLIGSVTYQGVKTEKVAAYTVIGPVTVTLSTTSTASHDGHILESAETSNAGGTQNNKASTFFLGDDAANNQYRAILSFNTTLPSNAVITKVTLKIKNAGVVGTNPFSTHGQLLVDIRNGAFSNNNALQLGDFSAAASKSNIGSIPKALSGGWYAKVWTSGIFDYINKTGITQFRLRFAKDDNNDLGADYLKIYSGNAGAANRPQLIIEYYVP